MAFLALVPSVLGRDWWNTWDYPERIKDQFFGMPLTEEDLLSPFNYHGFQIQPRTQASIDNSGKSEVKNEEKQFQVSLNLKHFKQEEIEVKVVDDYIVIHGKHEEKSDESGFCARVYAQIYAAESLPIRNGHFHFEP
ncbi:hypothetical protein CEXT_359931 [Caerostris extrusa]|uniref:SHSP domain-containing protein n=1 Tax=Caerostris extrusa TaxID=172846 RepID=A0AAV4Y808_CAEEX|nr:hypothetical protein CEXT_359931 [Caerostris extrusa]